MSAPSKEEIARIVGVARDEAPLIHLESYTTVASVIAYLADENERLRAPLADAEHELADCRDQLAGLRAERAECLALLDDDGGLVQITTEWNERRRALKDE